MCPVFNQIGETFGGFDLAVRIPFPLSFHILNISLPARTHRRFLPQRPFQPYPRLPSRRCRDPQIRTLTEEYRDALGVLGVG